MPRFLYLRSPRGRMFPLFAPGSMAHGDRAWDRYGVRLFAHGWQLVRV